jgi:uncharacterized protein
MPETQYKAILPKPTRASAPFWDACDREELLLPRCQSCGHVFYYPRIGCPSCGSRDLGWHRSRGRGRIFTHSRVRVSFYGDSWKSQLPYTVVLVDLEEGPRMLSRLVGADAGDAASGDRVEVAFIEIEGRKLPFFKRSTAQQEEM